MASVSGDIVVRGLSEISGALGQLSGKAGTRVIRNGLYAGGVVLRNNARSIVRVRSGALKKSIGVRRWDPKGGTGVMAVSARVDSSRFVFTPIGNVKRYSVGKMGKWKDISKDLRVRPELYAHIVERGSKNSRAYPFLVKTLREKGQAAVDAVVQRMRDGLDDEVAKLRVK